MNKIKIEQFYGTSHRRLREFMEKEFQFLNNKINKIMSVATDLKTLVDQLTGNLATTKTALDNIATGVKTIVSGLPATGGLTADEVTALKAQLTDAVSQSTDVANEAGQDAAAVTAAQPPAPAADGTPTA